MSPKPASAWRLAAAFSVVGLLALVVTPASAHRPTQNNQHFAPDEFNGDGHSVDGCAGSGAPHCDPVGGPDPTPSTAEGEIVSDANDGFGEAYELRALTDATAAFYDWYSCTDGQTPTAFGAACQPIATDATPDVTVRPPGGSTHHAWTGSWNLGGGEARRGRPGISSARPARATPSTADRPSTRRTARSAP
ncbi:MAG: hypothetical protein ACRDHK_11960 [Actinomycetota bacterium]